MKLCNKCEIKKDYSEFYKERNGKNGVRSICKSCDIKRRVGFRKNNLNQERKTARLRYDKDESKIARLKIKEKNSQYFAEAQKKHYYKNIEYSREKHRIYDKERRSNDSIFKLRRSLSNRINRIINNQGFKKRSKTESMLGCSWEEFKQYLESKFQPGMTWDNYGEWEIDHIIPCCSAINEQELLILQIYTNLQPLWKVDHVIKTTVDLQYRGKST